MILKNDPLGAANYVWRGDFSASYSLVTSFTPPAAIETANTTVTYGNAFSSTHGFKVAIYSRSANPMILGDTGLYTITFSCPWHADYVVTAASFLSSTAWTIEVDNLALTGGCDDWTIAFDEMRFYIGGTLQLTIASPTVYTSGTGYDPRKNITAMARNSTEDPNAISPTPAPEPCAGDCPDQQGWTLQNSGTYTSGWRWNYSGGTWHYAELSFDASPFDTMPDCGDCHPTKPGPTYTNSWDVQISSEFYWRVAVIDHGTILCYCTDGITTAGTPAVAHEWEVDQDFRKSSASLNLHRRDGSIRDYQLQRDDTCNGTESTVTTTVVPDHVVCEEDLEAAKETSKTYCLKVLSAGVCPTPEPDQPPFTVHCELPPSTSCGEYCRNAVTWTKKPDCSDVIGGVWNHTTWDERFLVSWVDGHGANIRSWDFLLPKGLSSTVQISADEHYEQCRVYDDNRLRLYALIGKNDGSTLACYRAWSDDGGKTWSSIEAMGITNGRFPTGSSNPLGDRLEAAFVYNSGTSGPGKIYVLYRSSGDTSFGGPVVCKDSTGTALSFADTSFHIHFGHDSAARVILSANIQGETSPSSWFSTDALSGGMTFTRFS
ncbi:MAG: hypothetical protein JST12_18090 [Armatimonadetes bacterium]|nr:hypothetical protein [Armatimonadota bacterium]